MLCYCLLRSFLFYVSFSSPLVNSDFIYQYSYHNLNLFFPLCSLYCYHLSCFILNPSYSPFHPLSPFPSALSHSLHILFPSLLLSPFPPALFLPLFIFYLPPSLLTPFPSALSLQLSISCSLPPSFPLPSGFIYPTISPSSLLLSLFPPGLFIPLSIFYLPPYTHSLPFCLVPPTTYLPTSILLYVFISPSIFPRPSLLLSIPSPPALSLPLSISSPPSPQDAYRPIDMV